MNDKVKYPEITVELIGQNGNIFNLIGICTHAMRRGGVNRDERDKFVDEVTHARELCGSAGGYHAVGQRGIGSSQVYKQQLLFGSCCLLFGKNKVKIPKKQPKIQD